MSLEPSFFHSKQLQLSQLFLIGELLHICEHFMALLWTFSNKSMCYSVRMGETDIYIYTGPNATLYSYNPSFLPCGSTLHLCAQLQNVSNFAIGDTSPDLLLTPICTVVNGQFQNKSCSSHFLTRSLALH